MMHGALQQPVTWAEDRALQRCNPSAVPGVGVKTGPDQGPSDQGRPGRTTTSHQHESEKPVWHDARLPTARRLLPLANADRPEFQFTLNQDKAVEGIVMTDVAEALAAIETWTPDEQAELAQRIRERLVSQGWVPESSPEQLAEIERRLDDALLHPENVVTWDEVVAHARRRKAP
jgi:putative addiction module component (TIGR02574 family)